MDFAVRQKIYSYENFIFCKTEPLNFFQTVVLYFYHYTYFAYNYGVSCDVKDCP